MKKFYVQLNQPSGDYCEILGEFDNKCDAINFATEYQKNTNEVLISDIVNALNNKFDKQWHYFYNLERTDFQQYLKEYMETDILEEVNSSYFENLTMELEIVEMIANDNTDEFDLGDWTTCAEYLLEPNDLNEHKQLYSLLKRYGFDILADIPKSNKII